METDGNSYTQCDCQSTISVFFIMPFFYWPDNEYKVPHSKEASPQRSATSIKETVRPKVSFGPYKEKHKSESAKQKQKDLPKQTRRAARGHYTPNPGKRNVCTSIVIHPKISNFLLLGKLLNLYFPPFLQIKFTITALHLLISALPVHVGLA